MGTRELPWGYSATATRERRQSRKPSLQMNRETTDLDLADVFHTHLTPAIRGELYTRYCGLSIAKLYMKCSRS